MKRSHRRAVLIIGVAAGLVVLAPLARLFFQGGAGAGAPSQRLWNAIVDVESDGNPRAFNPHSGATGIAQIRKVCLTDCNRIARREGDGREFAPSDRLRPGTSREMWRIYLEHYGRQYQRKTGRTPTDEVYARIWNGGPTGWRKASTLIYLARIRAAPE
jgi:hypothetical protein